MSKDLYAAGAVLRFYGHETQKPCFIQYAHRRLGRPAASLSLPAESTGLAPRGELPERAHAPRLNCPAGHQGLLRQGKKGPH